MIQHGSMKEEVPMCWWWCLSTQTDALFGQKYADTPVSVYFNQSSILHRPCNNLCFTRTICVWMQPGVCFYASCLLSLFCRRDCVLGSECYQNTGDLHSILCLNASCVDTGLVSVQGNLTAPAYWTMIFQTRSSPKSTKRVWIKTLHSQSNVDSPHKNTRKTETRLRQIRVKIPTKKNTHKTETNVHQNINKTKKNPKQ